MGNLGERGQGKSNLRIHRQTIACTHGLFTGRAMDRFCAISELEEIVTTDTVSLSEEMVAQAKMTVLSVAPLLADDPAHPSW